MGPLSSEWLPKHLGHVNHAIFSFLVPDMHAESFARFHGTSVSTPKGGSPVAKKGVPSIVGPDHNGTIKSQFSHATVDVRTQPASNYCTVSGDQKVSAKQKKKSQTIVNISRPGLCFLAHEKP